MDKLVMIKLVQNSNIYNKIFEDDVEHANIRENIQTFRSLKPSFQALTLGVSALFSALFLNCPVA
jgi:hypothetical protein